MNTIFWPQKGAKTSKLVNQKEQNRQLFSTEGNKGF
jgi:hypothetical protein